MGKIWEVDFTRFSGSSAVAYDNIGSQDLTVPSNIVRVSGTVPGFNYRPGIYFSLDGIDTQSYNLQASNTSNAFWRHPDNTRSWNMWLYQVNSLSSNTWWDSGNAQDSYLWVSNLSLASNSDNGFYAAGGGSSTYRCRFNSNALDSGFTPQSNSWHMLTATLDRTNSTVKFYVDGVLRASASGASYMPATGTSNEQCIGYRHLNDEGTFYLGLVQTYDHVLSSGEVSALYGTFLVDSVIGESTPYQTLSGYVFGTDGLPSSGATVYLLHQDTNNIEAMVTTSGDGYYEVIVPYSGSYTVISTLTPSGGARAVAMLATSGGLYFP